MSLKNKTCPMCFKGKLKRETRLMKYECFEKVLTVEQPGLYCDICGEGILTGSDLLINENELNRFQEQSKKELLERLKDTRKKLKITQKQASELLGGGVNAFSRYERGEITPPLAVRQILNLLDKYPYLLDDVKKYREQA